MPHAVRLFKYDLSQGMARQMSLGMLGFHLEAIWHTSVVVYDREFYFDGGVGIANGQPRSTRFGSPLEVVDMGTTEVEPMDFAAWVREMGSKFGPDDYQLLERNCNHFSSDALEFLVGQRVSSDVASMIDRVMATPLGQMLRPAMEAMTTAPAPPASPAQPEQPGRPQQLALLSHGPSDAAVERRASAAVQEAAGWHDPREAVRGLELVLRVMQNCLNYSTDTRCHGQINAAGNAFAPAMSFAPAVELLHAIGFYPTEQDPSKWQLHPGIQSRATYNFIGVIVSSAIENLRELIRIDASAAE
jgi:hypothetical protein